MFFVGREYLIFIDSLSHFIPQDRWVFFLSMNRQPRAL